MARLKDHQAVQWAKENPLWAGAAAMLLVPVAVMLASAASVLALALLPLIATALAMAGAMLLLTGRTKDVAKEKDSRREPPVVEAEPPMPKFGPAGALKQSDTFDVLHSVMKERIFIIDGAMGTSIQKYKLTEEDYRGERYKDHAHDLKGNNDILVITRPDVIHEIHCKFLESGADIIETNTFNGTTISQADYSLDTLDEVVLINKTAAELAKKAAAEYTAKDPSKPRFVAGAIGPTNRTLSVSPSVENPAYRATTFDEVKKAYYEQVGALMDGGVDILLVETIFDTLNSKAALFAIEEYFESNLSKVCDCYVFCYPNAGLPNAMGGYDQKGDEFAVEVEDFCKAGIVNGLGGCCGTCFEHIAATYEMTKNYKPREVPVMENCLRLSGLEPLVYKPDSSNMRKTFINLGERCNVAGSTIFKKAIVDGNFDKALGIALKQVEAGAHVIDINMDDGLIDGVSAMIKFVNLLVSEPEASRVPFMIDSSKFEVVEAGLKCSQGKAIVNSISLKEGEEDFIKKAKIVKMHGAAVVVMAFDEQGQAATCDEKAGMDMGIVNSAQVIADEYEKIDKELLEYVEDVLFNKRPDATERILEYAATLEPKCPPTAVRKIGGNKFVATPKENPKPEGYDPVAPADPSSLPPVPEYIPYQAQLKQSDTFDVLHSVMKERIFIIDGAMGTSIQKYKLTEEDYRGERYKDHAHDLKGNNDILVITRPDVIHEIHCKFLESGADIIETNTFNGTTISQADYSLDTLDEVVLINKTAAELAKKAAAEYTAKDPSKPRFVAGAIGPTNRTLSVSPSVENPAYRATTFDEVKKAYYEQVGALMDGGVDILLVETIFDTLNSKAALFAIEEYFESNLSKVCDCYVFCYPNAGLPNAMGGYDQKGDEFAVEVEDFCKAGIVNGLGGCCGTCFEHIAATYEMTKNYKPREVPVMENCLRLSGLEPLVYKPDSSNMRKTFINLGERCNVAGSTIFKKAIVDGNFDKALGIALKQVEAGAHVIDINMDDGLIDGVSAMIKFVNLLVSEPEASRVPFMIDSSKFEVVEAGLKCSQGKAIVNSISLKEGEEDFIKKAKIVKMHGAAVVVMAFDEQGQAATCDEKAGMDMGIVNSAQVIADEYEKIDKELLEYVEDVLFNRCD
eukprot:jgi/Pico_ML_1/51735/g300.t1